MIDKKLSNLKNDIPSIDITLLKKGIYDKYDEIKNRKPNFIFRPIYVGLIVPIVILLVFTFSMVFFNNNEQIGGYYKKSESVLLEDSLYNIFDEVSFINNESSYSIDELYELKIVNDDELNKVKKLESNTKLNKGYELLNELNNDFSYFVFMGKINNNDKICLVDKNSSSNLVIYHIINYKLEISINKIKEDYNLYHNINKDKINFDIEVMSKNNITNKLEIRYSFNDIKNNNLSYIMKDNKVASVFSSLDDSLLNKVNTYLEGYDENSMCYIKELSFDSIVPPQKVYCLLYNKVKSFSSRINGIKNNNKTIYEVEKSTENSPLMVAYVNEETYELISKVYQNTSLTYHGKYPTGMAIYKSLLDEGYIEDNIRWYEFTWDSFIYKELDSYYLLDAYIYEDITVIKDIINDININFNFEIMKEKALSGGGGKYYANKTNEEKSTSLIYGEKMSLYEFNEDNIEQIMFNVTSNKEIEQISYLEKEKFITYLSIPSNATFGNNTFNIVYEGYTDEISELIYKVETISKKISITNGKYTVTFLPDGTPILLEPSDEGEKIFDIVIGDMYYFKYDDYINYIKSKLM